MIDLVYRSDLAAPLLDTDSNWMTEVAPDVLIDGALVRACQHFVDPRAEMFEAQFTKSITDLNLQSTDDDLINAAVSPAMNMNFGDD